MATLEKNGLTENTLVIFTSDNGGMINVTGQRAIRQGHQLNGDLLGFKFDAWEGGHRVPFIARWPGRIKAGTESSQLICNVDLLATMAALTGYELKADELARTVSTFSPLSPANRRCLFVITLSSARASLPILHFGSAIGCSLRVEVVVVLVARSLAATGSAVRRL